MEIFLLHVQYVVTKWDQTSRGLLEVTSQDVIWRYGGDCEKRLVYAV